jgi:NADP-reducing hydrogenase subunit HndD
MKIKINGKEYKVKSGATILETCQSIGVDIPNLCYCRNIGAIASCRVCVVEVKGWNNLVTACNTPVTEGMEIRTNTTRVLEARKTVLELLLSDHQLDCLKCPRTSDCRLKLAAEDAGANAERFLRNKEFVNVDTNNDYIKRNPNKCILCGRCTRMCSASQQVGVLSTNGRGFNSRIGVAFDKSLESVPCITCGQCVANCPTAALAEIDNLDLLKQKLNDPNLHVVIATAPSTRIAIGEGFNMPTGTDATGKMVASLRRLGFDRVFDLNLAADFTIMEEGTEFLSRLACNKNLPMLTSCCPGWINYAQMYHADLIPNISTTKSPQQIFGALLKTYYAEKAGIDPKKIFTVMLMPCIAKQSEANRKGIDSSTKYRDVDMTITVRQLVKLIKENRINFQSLKDEKFDDPLSLSSGAGLIFGTTGGVMEAALRTLSEKLLGKRLDNIDFQSVRGEKGIKIAEVELGNILARVAVVSGMSNAERLLQQVKNGEETLHFIEIMACPNGCVNGGGMPVHNAPIQDNFTNSVNRAKTLYKMDQYNNLRRSHENPVVAEIYRDFLGEPNSDLAHKLLHTSYKPRKKY